MCSASNPFPRRPRYPKTSDDLHGWPSPSEAVAEVRAIGRISVPSALTGLVLYSRSMISMLFLGRLGELELAGGSLAIAFANITGYSVLSGLAMGMEPICAQAFGSGQRELLGLTLHRTVLLLLAASMPLSVLWMNAGTILVWCRQDVEISATASRFLGPAVLDLMVLAVLIPLRVYLRCQNLVLPITYCSIVSMLMHVPITYLLVVQLRQGVAGVALATAWTDLNLLQLLAGYVALRQRESWVAPGAESLRGWLPLLRLAGPSCAAVCLEWWWYELMILLCGLLADAKAAVAAMGVLIQATSLVYVFPAALGLAAATRVGNELGAGRSAGARRSALVAMCCAGALGLCAAGFAAVARGWWGRLFTADPGILALTAAALPVVGLCEVGNCPQTTGCGVLRGSARPSAGANINLGSFYGVGLPVAAALAFRAGMGFRGLWMGLLAAQVTCAGLMLRAVAGTDWVAETARAVELTGAYCDGGGSAAAAVEGKLEGEIDAQIMSSHGDGGGGDGKMVPLDTDPLIMA